MATLPELFLGPVLPQFFGEKSTPEERDLSKLVPDEFYPASLYPNLSNKDREAGFYADWFHGDKNGHVTADELVAYSKEVHPQLVGLEPRLNQTQLSKLIGKFDPTYLQEKEIVDTLECWQIVQVENLSKLETQAKTLKEKVSVKDLNNSVSMLKKHIDELVKTHGDFDQSTIKQKVFEQFQSTFTQSKTTRILVALMNDPNIARDLVASYLLIKAVQLSDPELFAVADSLVRESKNSELRRIFDQAAKTLPLVFGDRKPLEPDWVVIGEPRRESKPVF